MGTFWKSLGNFFTGKSITEPNKPLRKELKDVKAGENITIEWHRIKGKIGTVICVNNDPLTQKILIEVNWNNAKPGDLLTEKVVFDYKDEEFKNFALLNPIDIPLKVNHSVVKPKDHEVKDLQKKMQEALADEQYELANQCKIKIEEILNSK